MLLRTSYVNHIYVTTASFSSILQLGDSRIINGLTRALAVQREVEIDYGNEGNFSVYPAFTEPIPVTPITEEMTYLTHNLNPVIKISKINVLAFSASSILHVGNSQNIYLEARVKHIRQLEPHEEEQV